MLIFVAKRYKISYRAQHIKFEKRTILKTSDFTSYFKNNLFNDGVSIRFPI